MLLTTDVLGGVWRYTVELASSLATHHGVVPVVAVLGPGPDASQRREIERIPGATLVDTALPLDWTAPDPASLARAAAALAALAGREGVGSVHLHAPALGGDAVWAMPVVTVVHSCLRTWWRAMRGAAVALPPDFAWRDDAASRGLARADAIVAPTRCFAAAIGAAYGDGIAPVAIHNGARPPPGADGDADAGGMRERAVLGCGRLWDEAKDVATLDRAAARLPSVPVRVAGPLGGPNGERAPPLRAATALGALAPDALGRVRAAATVFAGTARYEPFGLAVLEAAQSGLALVLADIPTFRELWDGAALFFPPGDDASLAVALGRALDDPVPLASRAVARARRYAPERMAADTWALHASLRASREQAADACAAADAAVPGAARGAGRERGP